MKNKIKWAFVGPGAGHKFLPRNYSEFKKLYSGNTGNLLYYFATQTLIKFNGGHFGVANIPEAFNKSTNGIVFSMANHLGAHTDMSVRGLKIDNLQTSVVGLGLGAQTKDATDDLSYIPEGSIRYLIEFTEKSLTSSPNITVRGDYTLSIMEKLGLSKKVISIGCQTNFINANKNLGMNIGQQIKDSKFDKISIAAGNPTKKEFRKLETSLLSLAIENNGDYIVQHPESLIKLTANFTDEEFIEGWKKTSPIYLEYGIDEKKLYRAVKDRFKLYNDVPQWMRSHRQSDVVVGTRIHGIQSALQSGVPAICLYIDSRTKELCEKMKIPNAAAVNYESGISYSSIKRILNDWDYEEYDRTRLLLAKDFKQFLENNLIEVSGTLTKLTS